MTAPEVLTVEDVVFLHEQQLARYGGGAVDCPQSGIASAAKASSPKGVGTVEERLDELIASQQKLSDEILSGGAESALTEMSNEALMAMVSLDLSAALAD